MPVLLHYPLQENQDQFPEIFGQSLIFPHPVEPGICLEYVEMGVHRELVVAVLFGQAHILYWTPVARAGLCPSSQRAVVAVFFNAAVERAGLVEHRRVAAVVVHLREGIYCEGN